MEVERSWRPPERGTRLCLLKQHSRFSPMNAGGGNVPGQQQVLSALKTVRQLSACPGREREPKKRELVEEIRVGRSLPSSWMRLDGHKAKNVGKVQPPRSPASTQSMEEIRAMDGANTFCIPGSSVPQEPHLEILTYRCCPSTSLPAQP